MAFAYDTLITFSDGSQKPIQHFYMNDPVWGADKQKPNAWAEKPVVLILDSHTINPLIRIEFQNGARREFLLVTWDQSFLTPTNTFKKARHLIPGKDVLVTENGSTCPVLSSHELLVDTKIRDIATTKKPGEYNGQLIIANGIIVGDYMTR